MVEQCPSKSKAEVRVLLDVPMIFRKNRSRRTYSVSSNLKPIATVVGNSETLQKYCLKDYVGLFPGYEDKDDIHLRQFEGESILVHMRPDKGIIGDALPAGIYRLDHDEYGEYELKVLENFKTDNYVVLSNSRVNELRKDIELFFNNKNKYSELNLMYKRGCLLYGPPGNGKTLGIQTAIDTSVQNYDAIVLFLSNEIVDFGNLLDIRDSLKGRNVVFVIEEITERLENGETFLNFLDGEYAWENTYQISTTNYPELLPSNIVERPSRYDLVLEVENPNREDRKTYLSNLVGSVTEEVLDSTEGFSTAFLKELALRSLLYDKSVIEVIVELETLKKKVKSQFKGNNGKLGF